jgi:hypothetical protein
MVGGCASGYECGGGGKCVKPLACTNDSVCLGYTCDVIRKTCRVECLYDGMCVKGYGCDGERSCVKDVPCTDDKPCKGYACDKSVKVCRVSCVPFVPNHCAAGYTCSDFSCVPK